MSDGVPTWELHSERTVFEVQSHVRLGLAELTAPSGERVSHARVWIPDAAIALVVDPEREAVLMLRRHRWVVDRIGYELLGGLIDPGEDPRETAARECYEESGYEPRGPGEHLISVEPLPGMVASTMHIYVWRHGADLVAEPSDPHEAGVIEWVPLSRTRQLAADRQLLGSGTALALAQYFSK